MTDFFVDPRNGDDSFVGSLAFPVKTLNQAEVLAGTNDRIFFYPGIYKMTDGRPKNEAVGRQHTALNKWTVVFIDDRNDGQPMVDFIGDKYLRMSGLIFDGFQNVPFLDQNITGANNDARLIIDNCIFRNIPDKFFDNNLGGKQTIDAVDCLWVGCGNAGVKFSEQLDNDITVDPQRGRFQNCAWINCTYGGDALWDLNDSGVDIIGCIITGCTLNRIYDVPVNDVFKGKWNFNIFNPNNVLNIGFGRTTTGERGALNGSIAQGTLTIVDNPTDGDTITVDGRLYTFQDTLTNVDGNVQIEVAVGSTRNNLVNAFLRIGTPGTQYAAATIEHPTVIMAAFILDDAILTAKEPGTAGNAIPTVSSFASGNNFFDAVTLGTTTAGTDGWRQLTPNDQNSVEADPLIVEIARGIYGTVPGGPADRAGFGTSTVGPQRLRVGMSAGLTPAAWNGGTSLEGTTDLADPTRVAIVSDNIKLVGGYKAFGKWRTLVFDMGETRPVIGNFFLEQIKEFYPEVGVDIDIAATDGIQQIQIRLGLTLSLLTASIPFAVTLGEEFSVPIRARFIELTIPLRNDGPEALLFDDGTLFV